MNMYGLACVHLYMWTDRHVDGRMDMWTDGRTDAQTCNDIVLSHDRKRIFVKKYFQESKKSSKCPC